LYRRERPHLVFHYTIKPVIYGSLAAALTGVPSLSTVTGAGYAFMRDGLLQHLVRRLYRLALRFPQAVFFQNPDDRDFFLRAGLVRESQVRTVPGSGVNLDNYAPDLEAEKSRDQGGKMVFLFMGRLLWDKGIGELAEAAAMVRRHFPLAEVWVLGRTDPDNPAAVPEGQIRQWEREGRFTWLGWVQDVRPLISQSDVVVLPSYREGIPRSLLEAMAMGKPIITTDGVGCREVIEDGRNGFMVPVKDTEALAAAMIKMIHLGEEGRREMGLYGRRKAEREFDERLVIQAYLREIDRILAAEGQAAKS
jgi:glycosyltransferase involved in cell wall biosynthesis